MNRRALLGRLAVVGLTGSVAGCLESGGMGGSDGEVGDGSTVSVGAHSEFGDILVDAQGMVLYLFTTDESGVSSCYEGCAENWPPLTVEGDPTTGSGVRTDVATIKRDDGGRQVTAGGYPLYYYAGDENPGDANGQGIGDVWYVVAPDGSKVTGAVDDGDDGYY